jgi:hypothetical protein
MVDKPDDISRLDPIKKIGDDQHKPASSPTSGQPFESYMKEKAAADVPQKTPAASPFELAHGKTNLATAPNFDTILHQVKSAQGIFGDISTQLNTKNLKLKQSQRYLLRSKLSDANGHLRAANARLGAEIPAPPPPSGKTIIHKFLDFVTEGQGNLKAAQQQIMQLRDKGESLKPADFLALQLKFGHAQQEIEYASIMLAKAVENMRTLFNIQI